MLTLVELLVVDVDHRKTMPRVMTEDGTIAHHRRHREETICEDYWTRMMEDPSWDSQPIHLTDALHGVTEQRKAALLLGLPCAG